VTGRARAAGRTRARWKQAAIACAVVVGLLGLSELAAWFVALGRPRVAEYTVPTYLEPSAALGRVPAPSMRVRSQKMVGAQSAYVVTYSFDAHRRRAVSGDPAAAHERFLLFFGDEETFGVGLEDDATLPAAASRLRPDTRVYDYAFPGHGPQHVLARLEASDLRHEVREAAGAAVYVLADGALDRLVGGSASLAGPDDLPYYRLDDGEAVRDGFFRTTRPIYSFVVGAVGRSALMQSLGVAWPTRVRTEDGALACAVLGKAKRLLAEWLGPTPFVVVLHPASAGAADLTPCLAPLGIPGLDYRARFSGPASTDMRIPLDGHTSARGNQALAARLVDDLTRIRP
jgi:hypothetical protein